MKAVQQHFPVVPCNSVVLILESEDEILHF